jgi:hypothetical protein
LKNIAVIKMSELTTDKVMNTQEQKVGRSNFAVFATAGLASTALLIATLWGFNITSFTTTDLATLEAPSTFLQEIDSTFTNVQEAYQVDASEGRSLASAQKRKSARQARTRRNKKAKKAAVGSSEVFNLSLTQFA